MHATHDSSHELAEENAVDIKNYGVYGAVSNQIGLPLGLDPIPPFKAAFFGLICVRQSRVFGVF